MLVEQLHQLGEVSQRAGQTVDLVDDDDVDLAAADVAQHLSQRRAVEGGAGQTAIVIPGPDQPPASQASRWASRELNSRSRLCSVDLRV